jgi:shikimate 5-dehydrogenase
LVGVSAEVFTWWTDLDAPLDAMSAAALDQLGRER